MQPAPSFDVSRAVLEDYLDTRMFPAHLTVTEWRPLSAALADATVTPDTHLVTFDIGGTIFASAMQMVLSYNVIQGEAEGRPWMMTFCNACNTGMVFNPMLDGQRLTFHRRGSYDGLLLIWDKETNTYWQHVLGVGLHGPNAGRQLETITVTRQRRAAELVDHPDVRLLVSPLTPLQVKLARAMERMRAQPETVEDGIFAQVRAEDNRLPRFELGLGVWNDQRSLYVPLTTLHKANNALILPFDGRRLLVYQPPVAMAPSAAYVDDGVSVGYWDGDTLRLRGGLALDHDGWVLASGEHRPFEAPSQLLMRWFGFALTFPRPEIARVD